MTGGGEDPTQGDSTPRAARSLLDGSRSPVRRRSAASHARKYAVPLATRSEGTPRRAKPCYASSRRRGWAGCAGTGSRPAGRRGRDAGRVTRARAGTLGLDSPHSWHAQSESGGTGAPRIAGLLSSLQLVHEQGGGGESSSARS